MPVKTNRDGNIDLFSYKELGQIQKRETERRREKERKELMDDKSVADH